MFNHIMIGGNDIAAAKPLCDAILGALGVEPGVISPKGRCFIKPQQAFRHQQTIGQRRYRMGTAARLVFWLTVRSRKCLA